MWQFWVDRGGTFTDCVGKDPETGQLHVVKLPSTDAAPVTAIRKILGCPSGPLPPCQVVLATTLGTNALLQRRGAPTALIVTRGFADLLAIGDQTRPQLFAYHVVKQSLAAAVTIETSLRLDRDGRVLDELDFPALERQLQEAQAQRRDPRGERLLHVRRTMRVQDGHGHADHALGLRLSELPLERREVELVQHPAVAIQPQRGLECHRRVAGGRRAGLPGAHRDRAGRCLPDAVARRLPAPGGPGAGSARRGAERDVGRGVGRALSLIHI